MMKLHVEKTNEITDKLANISSEYSEIQLAYLFGSVARCEPDPKDIDIAILLEPNERKIENEFRIKLLKWNNWESIDLLNLRECSLELQFKIISGGFLFYKKNDNIRIEFEYQVITEYQDFESSREIFNELFYKRMEKEYGYKPKNRE